MTNTTDILPGTFSGIDTLIDRDGCRWTRHYAELETTRFLGLWAHVERTPTNLWALPDGSKTRIANLAMMAGPLTDPETGSVYDLGDGEFIGSLVVPGDPIYIDLPL